MMYISKYLGCDVSPIIKIVGVLTDCNNDEMSGRGWNSWSFGDQTGDSDIKTEQFLQCIENSTLKSESFYGNSK